MSTTAQTELVDSIESALDMSGLLFQAHPAHPEWDTTRPGATPGEVAAFVRDVPNERKSFISVRFFREGESVPDYEYEWPADTYEIVVSRGDGTQARDATTDRRRAAELVAREMERHE